MNTQNLPVAIIGAGPVGLAAAAHLIQRGETPIVFEAGSEIAANVRTWGHVPLFSPWRWCVDKAAVALLAQHGWQSPALDKLPTGNELIDDYLLPLAQTPELRPQIHLNARVTGISRRRIDKMKDAGRDAAPFVLQVELAGETETFLARAVIDASGTWATPNPIGADGLAAPGERANREQIFYGIPDVLGHERARYANKQVTVIGGGHSAINAILELSDLRQSAPQTQITWVLRKTNVAATYGGLENDELPGRGLLGVRIKQLVEQGALQVITPFFVTRLERTGPQLRIVGDGAQGETALLTDEIIAATGARPELGLLRELRLNLHQSVEAPAAIAPLIDPNLHSCGSVPPHGEAELRHPEAGFYMVGMKSYGRAPTFLLATGYEQVRSVVAGLAGDWAAAAEVQLELPETGVCGVPAAVDANGLSVGAGCCGSSATKAAPALITLDLPEFNPEINPVINLVPVGAKRTATPLVKLQPFALPASSLQPTALHLTAPQTVAASAACCGVDSCCTAEATVAADACCTPETKAAAKLATAPAKAGACCS